MSKAKTEPDNSEAVATEKPIIVTPAFTKQQILASGKYADNRDVLSVVLKDGKKYTELQIEQQIKEFMGKKVK